MLNMKQLSDQELLLYFTKFKREIKPKDHTCLFTTYKDCFSGKEAIRTLSSLFNLNTSDAISLGNQMISKKLFIHIIHESSELLDKKKEFYRFTNFRRCSKRLSILDMSQFTSNLDENYRKLIEEERKKNERIGDIRILLDDVYQDPYGGYNSNQMSSSLRGKSSNISTDDYDSSSPSSDNASSPLASLAKKLSLPLRMKKSPSIPTSLTMSSSPPLLSNSLESHMSTPWKKSPRGGGGNGFFTTSISCGKSSEATHKKSSSAEDLFLRPIRLNEYIEPTALIRSASFLKSTETNTDTITHDGRKNTSPSCKVSRSPSAHDLELKINLEDVDIYMERFTNIDDVLKVCNHDCNARIMKIIFVTLVITASKSL